MQEYIYIVREQQTQYTSHYWTFEKAKERAQQKFDNWRTDPEWSDITVGRSGYWKGLIDGEFELVWVESANIY
jgi:hypothetical protein